MRSLICLVTTPCGTGSGWLAKLGHCHFIVTNNHVLPDVETARRSNALFDYFVATDLQHNRHQRTVYFHPDLLFLTSKTLDFSVVAFHSSLSFEPRLAACFDLAATSQLPQQKSVVEIFQHPGGAPLANSRGVIELLEVASSKVLYSASTEYGSSGGVVLDGNLLPIALHRARRPENGWNEGVLLSAVVAQIQHTELMQIARESISSLPPELLPFASLVHFSLADANAALRTHRKQHGLPLLGWDVQQVQHFALISFELTSSLDVRSISDETNEVTDTETELPRYISCPVGEGDHYKTNKELGVDVALVQRELMLQHHGSCLECSPEHYKDSLAKGRQRAEQIANQSATALFSAELSMTLLRHEVSLAQHSIRVCNHCRGDGCCSGQRWLHCKPYGYHAAWCCPRCGAGLRSVSFHITGTMIWSKEDVCVRQCGPVDVSCQCVCMICKGKPVTLHTAAKTTTTIAVEQKLKQERVVLQMWLPQNPDAELDEITSALLEHVEAQPLLELDDALLTAEHFFAANSEASLAGRAPLPEQLAEKVALLAQAEPSTPLRRITWQTLRIDFRCFHRVTYGNVANKSNHLWMLGKEHRVWEPMK